MQIAVFEYAKKHPYISGAAVVVGALVVYVLFFRQNSATDTTIQGGVAAGGVDQATADQLALISAQSGASLAQTQATGAIQTQEQANAITGQQNLASIQASVQNNQISADLAATQIAANAQTTNAALQSTTAIQLAQIQQNANVAVANLQAGVMNNQIKSLQTQSLIGAFSSGGGIGGIFKGLTDGISAIASLF